MIYDGEVTRDEKFPKLETKASSFFLNFVFQANNYTFSNPRIAFELLMMSPSPDGYTTKNTKYIDDHYTPGRDH